MNVNHVLLIFKSALEYADFKGINNLLADNCQYINVERNILKNGKIEVYDFLNSMAKRTRDDNLAVYAHMMTLGEGTNEKEFFYEGERGLAIAYNEIDNYAIGMFIELDSNNFINKIIVSNNIPSFRLDKHRAENNSPPIDYIFYKKPVDFLDWLTAISIWLETGYVDEHSFYDSLADECCVHFQRKNQEPILLLGKEEIINDFDKMMNLFFYTMPHIIRDKNNKSFIKYGPMTIEIGRSLAGPANSVHIYIDDSED